MTGRAPVHRDRERANSFGSAAARYDRHRPRYPAALIADLVERQGIRVLDVGAGTGIATAQLRDAGADVLAVEPDPQMAEIAAQKGLAVEVSSFEDWDARGRTFDLVVFAQSFHWVDPEAGLRKVRTLLAPGGRLALLWNRIVPVTPSPAELGRAYEGILEEWQRPSTDVEGTHLDPLLAAAGLVGDRRRYVEHPHYACEAWVDLVTTYSNVLRLPQAEQGELRSRLTATIGAAGVHATNDALAVLCTRLT
ncbi:SAM-dependent methyltransferase [Mycolicibacterium fluoranthenivorans]|uniref:SAM-dependent methyltransferase n=1 Tax=Mycolicibacterium fluoranthenivorans TaxID=258505 RepID=A0A7X5TWF9_9MYCO|nr:class I SAM-dependent methyltransferase [Mycolicibacterium fluoranthenivorans]NIH94010.1 SAM-dependent methyltransferase [Mycolicibacterium fluoranthenivorans]